MRAYYFLLFTIYRFYKDTMRETQMLMFYTAGVSSVLFGFNLLTIHSLLKYYDLAEPIPNDFVLLSGGLLLGLLNYFLIVKKGKFLECGFKKSSWGGLSVISYIVITAVLAIVVANLNRDKIDRQRLANPVKMEQIQKDEKPKSLEGIIRKWFKETF